MLEFNPEGILITKLPFLVFTFPAIALASQYGDEVFIEGGRFYVGSVFGQHDYAAHTNVELADFMIMRSEVSYHLYADVHRWATSHGYSFGEGCNGATVEDCLPSDQDNGMHPVTHVEWSDAAIFANAFSEKRGLRPVYLNKDGQPARDSARYDFRPDRQADGYRLPTMEEWQIAARGGKTGLKNGSYGYRYSGSEEAKDVAWFPGIESSNRGSIPIERLQPNAAGIYDMSGNVSEWVYAFDVISGINMYYFCGGSFLLPTTSLASCDTHSAGYALPDTGFRLVRTHFR